MTGPYFGAWDKVGDTRKTYCPECGAPGPHQIAFVHGGNHAVSLTCNTCGDGWTEEGTKAPAEQRPTQAARLLAAIDRYQQENHRTKLGNGTTEDNGILRAIRATLDDFNMEDVVWMVERGQFILGTADHDRLTEVIEQGIERFGDAPRSIASHIITTRGIPQ